MRRWIVAMALTMLSATRGLQAQDWTYQIENLINGPDKITGTLLVKNTFLFDPTRFFAVVQVKLFLPGAGQGLGGMAAEQPGVNTRDLGGVFGSQDYEFISGYWSAAEMSIGSVRFGTPSVSTFINGLGLIGCSVPIVPPEGMIIDFHGGQTCDQSGFSGSLRLDFLFDRPAMFGPVDVSAFSVEVDGRYRDNPSYLVTPEPTMFLLVSAGLLALLAVSRRRAP